MADRRESVNDIDTSLREAFTGHQAALWTALPAFIVSFDPTKMTCEVQPTLQATLIDFNGNSKKVTMPKLVDCPVVFPSGGGFTLTFPLAAGDECLMIFASRCIDAWWQSGGVQVQAEFRMHDLSDGFVIPGPHSLPNVTPNVSTTNVQLRNKAGNSFVSIAPSGEIDINSFSNVSVQAPLINLTGAVTINGTLHVTDKVTTDVDFVAPNIPSYTLHTHGHIRRDTVNQQTDPPTSGS